MSEIFPVNEMLFKICIQEDEKEFSLKQQEEIKEGVIYRHHGILQFRIGNKIYATVDNEVVRKYLESLCYESAEYGSVAVIDPASPGFLNRKFDELHGQLYGKNPSIDWGKTNSKLEDDLMKDYRKYAALCSDEKLRDPYLTSSLGYSRLGDLRNFIKELETRDPYFMESLYEFSKIPEGETFKSMLRDKKLVGKEVLASKQLEKDLTSEEYLGRDSSKLLYSYVLKYLGKEQAELLESKMTKSVFGLDKASLDHFSNLLIKKVAQDYLKDSEARKEK